MLQALREIEGGIQLSLNVAARLPHLRRGPILESFLRQVYFTGVTAAGGVIPRACGLGVIIIAVMINMLDADVDLAVKILLLLVFREVGPLAAAIVVILRTGTAVSAEVAMMRVSGQTRALRYLGIDLYDYLVLPRVAGCMLATFFLLEVFGTRRTLWLAAAINLLVAMVARVVDRSWSGKFSESGGSGREDLPA